MWGRLCICLIYALELLNLRVEEKGFCAKEWSKDKGLSGETMLEPISVQPLLLGWSPREERMGLSLWKLWEKLHQGPNDKEGSWVWGRYSSPSPDSQGLFTDFQSRFLGQTLRFSLGRTTSSVPGSSLKEVIDVSQGLEQILQLTGFDTSLISRTERLRGCSGKDCRKLINNPSGTKEAWLKLASWWLWWNLMIQPHVFCFGQRLHSVNQKGK